MELPIPNKLKKLWEVCDLRGCIMLSLFLQAFLVSFAPLRRRSRSSFLVFFVWSAYLLADWVAAVAIGLITQSQADPCNFDTSNGDLFALWASFLLLHLGGPDSITSFALEDNEFWLRHFFGLVLQVLGAAYSIYLTLPNNKLWLPTMLVFFVGTIKYGERTYALYLASSDSFGATSLPAPNPGPDYEECVAAAAERIQISTQELHRCTDKHAELLTIEGSSLKDCSSDEIKQLQFARKLLEIFKGSMVLGMSLSTKCREASQRAFLKCDHATTAFRVVEYELSMLYELLHTKVAVAHSKFGYIVRFITFVFIFSASILFLLADKHTFGKFDIGLSYTLLIAAIVLDITSVTQIISSDFALSSSTPFLTWKKYFPSIIFNPKRKRWSDSVFQYDMIRYCLTFEEPKWVYKLAGYVNAKEILDKIKISLFHTSREKMTEDVMEIIFTELQKQSQLVFDSAKMPTDNLLVSEIDVRRTIQISGNLGEEDILNVETILEQHLETEVFHYNIDQGVGPTGTNHFNRTSRLISNYMFYLLLTQRTILPPSFSRQWKEKIQDAIDKLKRCIFKDSRISNHSEACKKLSGLLSPSKPRKESLLLAPVRSVCPMSEEELSAKEPYEELTRRWIKLLYTTALSCRPAEHAQQLSKGGGLLTFTWALTNHLGISLRKHLDVEVMIMWNWCAQGRIVPHKTVDR